MSARRVLKYPIGSCGMDIPLPLGSVPRHFDMQRGTPTVWVEVPGDVISTTACARRRFRVFGTGHMIPEGAVYIGTCMDGEFVWHLYEVSI